MGSAATGSGRLWLVVTTLATLFLSLTLATGPGGWKDCQKKFELTLTWESHAPDGLARDMILVNGQFPGPKLEINQGDEVEVVVCNKMPYNTTVHFHGVEMHLTPWDDGVPGVSQRQILPGNSFVYRWTATQYGSYWYHAHQQGQLEDGMYGPIVIYPKQSQPKPFSLITSDAKSLRAIERAAQNPETLMVSDFRHTPALDVIAIEHQAGMEIPCFDSILFNGKGSVDCWAPEKIASLLSPQQSSILQQANVSNFTPKGCMPTFIIANVVAKGFPTNPSVIPPDLVDVCTPSTGPKEVISVTKHGKHEDEKWVALDIIGTFSLLTVVFSIDQLPMYVYAVDGEYIKPQLVEAITVSNGDRYSVLIKLDTPGDYPMRAASVANTQVMASSATLSYRTDDENAPAPVTSTVPYILENGVPVSPSTTFFSQAQQKQFDPPELVSPTADKTYKLYMRVAGASFEWALNSSIFPASTLDFGADPVVLFHPDPSRNDNVTITTNNNTWVDLIFVTATKPMPAHPIHKHGNKMFLIGSGIGEFPWATVAEAAAAVPQNFNFVDPPRRDGFVTAQATPTNATWTAIRYHVVNPGAWLLHCHVQSHLTGGMSMVIQDGVDYWPTVPDEYLNYH